MSLSLAPSLDAFSVAAGVTFDARRGARLSGAVDDFASFGGWDSEEPLSAFLPTRPESLSLDAAVWLTVTLDWDFFRTVEAFENLDRDVTTVVAASSKRSAVSTGSQDFNGSSHGSI
jgi:hypothetical protein